MIQKRFVSLLLCAALALCLLAGCDTAASGSTGSASAPANSSASASSENIPSTTNEANTSGLRPNFDENSLFSSRKRRGPSPGRAQRHRTCP